MQINKTNKNDQIFNEPNVAIKVEHLFSVYNENSENQVVSLCDNNVSFEKNKIHFVIGSSGCGKSTLINHFNGLLKSNYGNVYVQNNYRIGHDLFLQDLLVGVLNTNKIDLKKTFKIAELENQSFIVAFQHKLPKSIIKIVFEAYYKTKVIKANFLKCINKNGIAFYLLKTNNEAYDIEIPNKMSYDKIINSEIKYVTNKDIWYKKFLGKKKIKKIKNLKKTLGIVFQFPEYQLFKDTILKDVMFGPLTLGIKKEKAYEESVKNLTSLGINESFFNRSPFDLSGGQKRRVAISGILSFDPDILVFDEPTAGLDPVGESEILDIIQKSKDQGKTVIVISHNMDHVLEKADNVVIMHDGEIIKIGSPYEIFTDNDLIKKTSIDKPKVIEVIDDLVKVNSKYSQIYNKQPKTVEELAKNIIEIQK